MGKEIENDASEFMIANPKAGEMYAFSIGNLEERKQWIDHILTDTYRWNRGNKICKVVKKDQIVRDYYICLQGNAFKRIVYSRNEKIIVHYVGDESSAIRLPHGNIKQKNLQSAKPFIRTSRIGKDEDEPPRKKTKNIFYERAKPIEILDPKTNDKTEDEPPKNHIFNRAKPIEILDPRIKKIDIEKYMAKEFENDASDFAITDPKAGEMYAFRIGNLEERKQWIDHILTDTYRWNRGNKICKVVKKDQIVRDYYICLQGNAFKRIVYSRNEKIIVHYVGDESSAIRLPHGNIKQKNLQSAKPFVRTSRIGKELIKSGYETSYFLPGQEILPRSKKALIQRNCLNVFFC